MAPHTRASWPSSGRPSSGSDGLVDRGKLGARVFGDPAALARLEAIVHPAVGQAIRARVEASTAPLVVIEAIKLLEAGLARSLCDQVWVALCTRRHQFARLQASRGMSADEVRRRLANQMPAGTDGRPGAPGHPHRRHDRRDRTDGFGRLGRVGARRCLRRSSAARRWPTAKAPRPC